MLPQFGAVEGGIVAAALGAVGTWLAQKALGAAAFQTAINDGFAKLTDDLRLERDELRSQLKESRKQFAAVTTAFNEFRREAQEHQAILENKIQELESTISKLTQEVKAS